MRLLVLWAATLAVASGLAVSVAAARDGMGGGFSGGGFHSGFQNFHGEFSGGFRDRDALRFRDRDDFRFRDRDDLRFRDRDDLRFRDGRFFFRRGAFRPFVFFGTTVFEPVPIALYPPVGYPAYAYAPVDGYGGCYQYSTTAVINGALVPAWGIACLQPDGTWRMMP
jgi:hypothetical protein